MTSPKAPASGRNSAIELLRILAMLMIVLSHICHHSGFDYTYSLATINRLFVQFGILGNLGVDIFVLISGYFLWNKPFRRTTLSQLLAQVWFYSLAIFLFFLVFTDYTYPSEQLLQVFFPTVYGEYWFFTTYFVLMLLCPYINQLLMSLNRQQHKAMNLTMLVLWAVIPTLTQQDMKSNDFLQVFLFYSLGAYFSKYPDNLFQSLRVRWAVTIGSFLALYGLTVAFAYCERFSPAFFGAFVPLYGRCGIPTVGCALGLFSLSAYCKPFHNPWVNLFSSCTFGVYLIHDNPVMRQYLWKGWLDQTDYFTSPSLIPRIVICVLLVYILCTAVEYLRLKTVAKPTTRLVDALLAKIFPS